MSIRTALAMSVALSGLLAAAPVLAQSDPLSGQKRGVQQGQQQSQQGFNRNEATSFFQAAERNLTEAVQNGNENAIQQWTQRHIADGATFVGIIESSNGTGSSAKAWAISTGTKQDLLRRQRTIFSVSPELLNTVNDFDLRIRVRSFQPIGDNVALVKTRISESGSIGGLGPVGSSGSARQQLGDAGAQSGQGFAGQGAGGGDAIASRSQRAPSQISFDASAECDHVMFRDPQSNTIQIGTTNCQGEARTSFGR